MLGVGPLSYGFGCQVPRRSPKAMVNSPGRESLTSGVHGGGKGLNSFDDVPFRRPSPRGRRWAEAEPKEPDAWRLPDQTSVVSDVSDLSGGGLPHQRRAHQLGQSERCGCQSRQSLRATARPRFQPVLPAEEVPCATWLHLMIGRRSNTAITQVRCGVRAWREYRPTSRSSTHTTQFSRSCPRPQGRQRPWGKPTTTRRMAGLLPA